MIDGIHGKDVREAREHEDSLTSDVFGHLRYLPPGVFWPELFANARDATEYERDLRKVLEDDPNFSLEQCTRLEIEFWPYYDGIGEPDMKLTFRDHEDRPRCTIFAEVKFHAEKSGTDDDDQLARYMKLVTDPPPDLAPYVCLIYLTPRESRHAINGTIGSKPHLEAFRDKLFRLRWQDVLDVAEHAAGQHGGDCFPYDTILTDAVALLRKRGLEHFKGMTHIGSLELFAITPALWNRPGSGMNEINALELFTIEKGAWIKSGMNEINALELFTIEKGAWIKSGMNEINALELFTVEKGAWIND